MTITATEPDLTVLFFPVLDYYNIIPVYMMGEFPRRHRMGRLKKFRKIPFFFFSSRTILTILYETRTTTNRVISGSGLAIVVGAGVEARVSRKSSFLFFYNPSSSPTAVMVTVVTIILKILLYFRRVLNTIANLQMCYKCIIL